MDNKRLDILIARIKESGDETAFAEFYELTSKGLFSYLLSIVRRREVAEDLMQDTYVRFRQSVQSYKSGNPAAFLIEIGKNIAFNHIKRAKYETATDFSEWEPVSGEKSIEDLADTTVTDAMKKVLTADEAQIVMLYVVQSSYIEKPVAKTKKAGASKAFRIATSAVACVLIMAIAITCGVMFAPKKDNSPISNYYYVQVSAGADKATAAADEKTDGAKITLTLNSEETVETVRAENVDGDMILHLSGELKGLKFDAATRKINEAARTLKFVDDADGLSVSVSGETAESFVKRLRAAFDFSLSIKTISKEDLANRAKKYLQNATSSMSFEQLTAAFAKRKSLLEESWGGDRSLFSDIYYQFAEEKISALIESSGLDVFKDFVKGSYYDMIDKLEKIEQGLPYPWNEQVAKIRISLENIDFAKIKTMYDNYITGLINDILNPSEQTSNSIFNI